MSLLLALLAASATVETAGAATSCTIRTPSNVTVELSALPPNEYAVQQVSIGGGISLATVFQLDREQSKLPVAIGFCHGSAGDSDVDDTAIDNVQAGTTAVDPSHWGASECTLVSKSGRTARIEYKPFDNGRATFASSTGWPWSNKVRADRGRQAVNKARVRITKLGGNRGLEATEYFYVVGANAANVILFDTLGSSANKAEPAAAICGYANITRAPSIR